MRLIKHSGGQTIAKMAGPVYVALCLADGRTKTDPQLDITPGSITSCRGARRLFITTQKGAAYWARRFGYTHYVEVEPANSTVWRNNRRGSASALRTLTRIRPLQALYGQYAECAPRAITDGRTPVPGCLANAQSREIVKYVPKISEKLMEKPITVYVYACRNPATNPFIGSGVELMRYSA